MSEELYNQFENLAKIAGVPTNTYIVSMRNQYITKNFIFVLMSLVVVIFCSFLIYTFHKKTFNGLEKEDETCIILGIFSGVGVLFGLIMITINLIYLFKISTSYEYLLNMIIKSGI